VSKAPSIVKLQQAEAGEPQTKEPTIALPAEWWLRVGHDLRGSIGPMRMAVQLLRSGRIGAIDRDESLQLIDRQIDALLVGIDDLSDLLRLSAGTLAFNSTPNDLTAVLDAAIGRSSVHKALSAKRQTLVCGLMDAAVIVDHDPARVTALLEFLIRKLTEIAPPGARMAIELQVASAVAELRITGFGNPLGLDSDLAHVLGEEPAEPPGTHAILMREVARLNGVEFSKADEIGGLVLRMPISPR
jgi:signal transduction histidine kinase